MHLDVNDDPFSPFSFNESEWLNSEEGKNYIKISNDNWIEANIAFGTDENEARAAGEQSFLAYTAQESPDNNS